MIAISSATSTSHVIFFAIKRQSTLAITTMVWESIHADDFRRKAPALHRRVVQVLQVIVLVVVLSITRKQLLAGWFRLTCPFSPQVLNHAYTHVLKRQTNKDKWWGEFRYVNDSS
jgi:hypothetical protein